MTKKKDQSNVDLYGGVTWCWSKGSGVTCVIADQFSNTPGSPKKFQKLQSYTKIMDFLLKNNLVKDKNKQKFSQKCRQSCENTKNDMNKYRDSMGNVVARS